MIQKIINFILDLFGINRTTVKERELNSKKEDLENKLEEIENESNSSDDIVDYLNK